VLAEQLAQRELQRMVEEERREMVGRAVPPARILTSCWGLLLMCRISHSSLALTSASWQSCIMQAALPRTEPRLGCHARCHRMTILHHDRYLVMGSQAPIRCLI
jgi:hypothetical protein